jgi:DNA mismatch repair ATPase MutL
LIIIRYAVHMDRQPIYVLFLECSSLLYDVCYEPDKTTIQFANWTPIIELVESAFSFLVSYISLTIL